MSMPGVTWYRSRDGSADFMLDLLVTQSPIPCKKFVNVINFYQSLVSHLCHDDKYICECSPCHFNLEGLGLI